MIGATVSSRSSFCWLYRASSSAVKNIINLTSLLAIWWCPCVELSLVLMPFSVFQCHIFLSFHTVHGVLKARILSDLPFPSPVDHVLSELSTITHPSWVALHGMVHSFTELDKAVVHTSSPIISWQIDGKTMEKVTDFIFLGSKITADGDCSHEIKRCLLLGRKAMTNLDSILKSKDITLLTKLHLVKAMAFPVVTYGCESWILKRAEHWRMDGFELWCWRRLLRVP